MIEHDSSITPVLGLLGDSAQRALEKRGSLDGKGNIVIMRDNNQFFRDLGSFSKRTRDYRPVKGQGKLCVVCALL